MNRALLTTAAVALCACGPMTEEDLVTDQEIGSIQTSSAALTVAQPTTAPTLAPVHVKLAWGYLAGDFRAREWIDWTGGLQISQGTATLDHLVFFERHDFPQPSEDPSQVRWTSRTLPHFDGVVVRLDPGAADAVLHVKTASFSHDFDVAQLAQGSEQEFAVDAEGHQLVISSVGDSACGGFAFGYERPSREGWLAFGGLLTNAKGEPQGRLRFRADGEAIQARVVDDAHQVIATGEGTLNGSDFSIALKKADGSALATVKGVFDAPSYSPRGHFQAHLDCN